MNCDKYVMNYVLSSLFTEGTGARIIQRKFSEIPESWYTSETQNKAGRDVAP